MFIDLFNQAVPVEIHDLFFQGVLAKNAAQHNLQKKNNKQWDQYQKHAHNT